MHPELVICAVRRARVGPIRMSNGEQLRVGPGARLAYKQGGQVVDFCDVRRNEALSNFIAGPHGEQSQNSTNASRRSAPIVR